MLRGAARVQLAFGWLVRHNHGDAVIVTHPWLHAGALCARAGLDGKWAARGWCRHGKGWVGC